MAYEVIRGGQGYSTQTIQAGDIITKKLPSRKSGGGGSSSPRTPNVSVNGFSVTIDGTGYSVPIENQAEFIRQQTGGVGSSAQSAIAQAQKNAELLRQEQARKQAEANVEKLRILQQKKALIKEGSITTIKKLIDAKTRQTIIETITKDKTQKNRVVERLNLDTGQKTFSVFNKQGSSRVYEGGYSSKDIQRIQNNLPKGDTLIYDKNTNEIKGIKSETLKANVPWTETAIKSYNNLLSKKNTSFNLKQKLKEDLQTGQSIMPPGVTIPKLKRAFSSPKQVLNAAKNIGKLLAVSTKQIPNVLKDYGISLGRGIIKVPLYAIDNYGRASQIKINFKTGKFYIPSGTKNISDSLGKTKNWFNYNYKTNPFKDPDYQNLGFTTGFILLGITSPGTAAKVFGVVKGKAVWDAVKDPTPYNVAVAETLFIPGTFKKIKKLKTRGDVFVAKIGELVPLKERITQVTDLVKNAGKKVEVITAKPSPKAGVTNVLSKSNPDYTYGNKIEFSTYKVGDAYPTSEYFLKGKATKIQNLLKQGVVRIEEVIVGRANKIYGKYIQNALLKNSRVPESFIKKYYVALKAEANRIGKPVLGISPKRLRGFAQAEQEWVKVLPSNYKPQKLKFAGYAEGGYKVYTDKSYTKNLKSFLKSKIKGKSIGLEYQKILADEKLQYLKGRPAIKGEYAEHGIEHLRAENVDPFAKRYAQKMNVKKFGNVFEQHDLAKVSDVESFVRFEHGEILYQLWKKGKYPDKNIYKLPKKIQTQIAEAYAGHTPVKPRFIDTLRKGWSENRVTKELIWYLKNKRNPYLQDVLTLDRIELPRAGRWNIKVNYKFLDKNALRRIYGSELNAVKNIRFLDWKTVPSRLRNRLGVKEINKIRLRDNVILKSLKNAYQKGVKPQRLLRKYGKTKTSFVSSTYKKPLLKKPLLKTSYKPRKRKTLVEEYKQSNYKKYKTKNYRDAYKQGFKDGYKGSYKKPTNYKLTLGKYQGAYKQGFKDAYKGSYKIDFKPSVGYTPTTKYPPRVPPRTPPTKKPPVLKIPSGFKKKNLLQKTQGYYVVVKRQGKFRKLHADPLILKDAKDYLAYTIDNKLSRTAFYIPIGQIKKAVAIPPRMRGYFSKTSKKLRPYRIRMGKKKAIINGYIEKSRFIGDTKEEQRELLKARSIMSQKKEKSRTTGFKTRKQAVFRRKTQRRPKINASQRRILLKRLEKARKVRMANLRKKRR